MNLPKRHKILLAFLVIVGGVYLASFGFSSNAVPKEFSEARLQGALISQVIVDKSNEISSDLEKVSKLESQRNFDEALTVTLGLIKKSQELRAEALKLSNQLEKMSLNVSGVDQREAKEAALEAIANQLALINRLLNYSEYLAQLLTTLKDKFLGYPYYTSVPDLIEKINSEVKEINNFNYLATSAMNRFDAAVE